MRSDKRQSEASKKALAKTLAGRKLLTMVVALAAPVVLLLAFQNCSPSMINFSALAPNEMASSGNGGGYSGKLTYYRYIPEFTCEGQPAPQAVITKQSAEELSFTIRENYSQLCGSADRPLATNKVTVSLMHDEVVSYEAVPFERIETRPSAIPDNLFEAWCRDIEPGALFEILTHFDHVALEAKAKIYSGQIVNGTVEVNKGPDLSISRLVTPSQVHLRNDEFSLQIDRARLSPVVGEFLGEFRRGSITKTLSCALGGSLDPRLWPIKQMTDMPIASRRGQPARQNYEISPDRQSVSFMTSLTPQNSEGFVTGPPVLMTWFKGGWNVLKSLTENGGVREFHYTPDSKRLVAISDPPSIGLARQLVLTDLFGQNLTLLNAFSNAEANTAASDFIVDPSSNYVFYGDRARNAGPNADSSVLWRASLSPLDPLPVQFSELSGSTLNPDSKVLEGSLKIYPDIKMIEYILINYTSPLTLSYETYAMSYDGSKVIRLTGYQPESEPLMLSGSYRHGMEQSIVRGRFALFTAISIKGAPFDPQTSNAFLYDLAGGARYDLGLVLAYGDILEQRGDWVFLRYQEWADPNAPLRQFKSRLVNPLRRVTRDFGYSPDVSLLSSDASTFFYTSNTNQSASTNILMRLALDNGVEAEICPQSDSRWLALVPYEESGETNAFGLLGLRATSSNGTKMEVLHVSNEGSCRVLNTFPLAAALPELVPLSMKVAQDRSSVLVRVRSVHSESSGRSEVLIFAPLNGEPAIQVTSPRHSALRIKDFDYFETTKTVIIQGDLNWPGRQEFFVWKAK